MQKCTLLGLEHDCLVAEYCLQNFPCAQTLLRVYLLDIKAYPEPRDNVLVSILFVVEIEVLERITEVCSSNGESESAGSGCKKQ